MSSRIPVSEELSGTTTDDYVALSTIKVLGHHEKLFILKNTHATRSLIFKVIAYTYPSGNSSTLLEDITLVALDTYKIKVTEPYAEIIIYVKSAVAATPATYVLDYVLNG